MEMIDVLAKLREISERNPEMSKAIDNVSRMNSPVKEGIEIKTSGDDAILAQILKLAGMVGGQNTPDMSAGPGDVPGMQSPMGGPAGRLGPDPFASDMGSDPMASLDKAMGGDPLGGNLGAPPMGGKSMEKPMGLGKLGGIGVPSGPKMGMDKPDMDSDMDLDMDMDMDKGMDSDPFDDPIDGESSMGAIAAGEGTSNRPYPNSPHEVTKGISAAIPNGQDLNRRKMTAPKVAGGDNPMHVAVTFD
jgi:hypothetical protein